jgi:hypothetical protein
MQSAQFTRIRKDTMTSLRLHALSASLFLLILPATRLHAQTLTSATVVGTVTDSSGAVVPGATVQIRQPETDAVSNTVTGSTGAYRFPFLKPGDYELTAATNGLSAEPVKIHLLVGQEQSVNLSLKVQSVQQTVVVDATNELLQTENGNNLTDYGEHYVENTPVNGGDITNIAFATPGARVNVGGGNTNFNVNGLPFSSVLFTYNGADIVEPYNNNNKSGSSNNTLGQNDVAEASVITNAYSAQYGRMAGAQVNYISKSGTNQFHGNLVENYNGDALNSNDFFANESNTPRGRAVANQYAASLGGPILRDKLTFFVNYEGLRYSLPTNAIVSLPSPALQSYVLANVSSSSLPYYQDLFNLYNKAPGLSRAVAVTNGSGPLQDGTGNMGCGKNNGLSGTPVPGESGATFGGSDGVSCAVAFVSTASSVNTEYLIDGRADYNISNTQKLYFRISRDAGVQSSSTSPISPLFNAISPQPWVIPQINYTWSIRPDLVNNLVLNGNFYSAIFYGSSNFTAAQQALPLAFSFTDGGAGDAGFQALGPAAPEGRRGQQLGVIDDLSWEHGRHTLQFGVNNRNNRITSTANQTGSIIGTYAFGSVSDFAHGNVADSKNYNSFTQSFPLLPTVHLRVDSLGFYGQDEWKVLKNLNLTYGARFEYQGNPWCKEKCYSRANTVFLGNGYQAGNGIPYNATLQTGIASDFIAFEGVVTEPRFAFAWSPLGEGKTVLRGGIGLFANTIPANIAASVYGNPPNKFSPKVTEGTVGLASDAGSSQAAAVASNTAFQAGFSSGDTLTDLKAAVPVGVTFSTPTLYVNPNRYHTIKALEWSFEVEQPLGLHDVASVSYVGNHSFDQPLTDVAANGWAENGYGSLPTSIPDPRFSTVTQIFDTGYSRYDGVSFAERHSLSHNLQGQASYTFSKALQLGTIYNPTVYELSGLAGPGSPSANYGPANFDTRHNFTADLVYTTPRLERALLRRTLTGIKFGGKIYLYSGRPFTVTDSGIASANVFSSSFGAVATTPASTSYSGSVLADTANPSVLGIHCGSSAVHTPCLNTSDFNLATATATTPAQTDWGNTKPNSFRGPGFASVALQAGKEITVTEHTRFELGGDAYNLLNHPNFGIPNADVNKGETLGTLTTDVSVPTSIYGTGQGAIVSGRVLVVYGKFTF